MDWQEAELTKIMFVGEKLIWGLKTQVITPKMERVFKHWFAEYVFFTDQRILLLWDVENYNLLQIPYNSVSAINSEGGPGSGGVAGVKCQAKGGGVIDIGSTYGSVGIQFPDAESFKYGQWLLNEASRGTQLSPPAGTPSIQGQVDPNATPQPPQQKSGGCFIATAAYGSPLAEEVLTLQMFRDQILSRYYLGRKMTDVYYVVSPPIAAFVSKIALAKSAVRLILRPIIHLVKRFMLR